jgi:hypothetical protein
MLTSITHLYQAWTRSHEKLVDRPVTEAGHGAVCSAALLYVRNEEIHSNRGRGGLRLEAMS